jgi:hypothetical protein
MNPCSKEADIATIKEHSRWMKESIERIETKLDTVLGSHAVLKARIAVYTTLSGGIFVAAIEVLKIYLK